MKYNWKIIFILIFLFLTAQLIGLYIINNYVGKELPYGIQRPHLNEDFSFLQFFINILIITGLAFLLFKLNAEKIIKVWFFFAVWFSMLIAFSSFLNQQFALIIAGIFSLFKIFKSNVIIHNLTELFIYAGVASIFVPIFNTFSISLLLVLISIYDAIAVWKTKHMIRLVKFQAKLKIFTGLFIPYTKKKSAILGGGDIGFPLLFTGVVMKDFGYNVLIVTFFVSLALFGLLILGNRKKYYPAMPFLTIGCFLGYLILNLI